MPGTRRRRACRTRRRRPAGWCRRVGRRRAGRTAPASACRGRPRRAWRRTGRSPRRRLPPLPVSTAGRAGCATRRCRCRGPSPGGSRPGARARRGTRRTGSAARACPVTGGQPSPSGRGRRHAPARGGRADGPPTPAASRRWSRRPWRPEPGRRRGHAGPSSPSGRCRTRRSGLAGRRPARRATRGGRRSWWCPGARRARRRRRGVPPPVSPDRARPTRPRRGSPATTRSSR